MVVKKTKTKKKIDQDMLPVIANEIRRDIINMLFTAGSGHSGGSLGMADIFTSLYFAVLNHDPKKPNWDDRDRVFLSNGHICPVQYATLAHAGYFPTSELKTLRQLGSRLQGHPHHLDLPGVENSSGPLGQGISQAVGAALALRLDHKKNYVYCLMSDGELNEGQIWEAYMLAAKHKLNNLTAIIDRNNIQIDGYTENVMPLEPLADKFKAFGWHVLEVNGHNIPEIVNTLEESKVVYEKPVVIIAHTIPGKGISFMENKFEWHGKTPNKNERDLAIKELMNERRHYVSS
ncbi:transketolase [Candidatus Falkowbacteria bacterium CG10_big_fil_rev_8_21_14_0_10_39_11]|uniref:Transketolase n=1 Tax=Candidatus Falkowbacteria bacterium CG10_big_fil_rev_8_21_14_0_10_39_11 TaxID=1974565 RepID=A0A2H0V5G7_9BACT|nr:MAG: transketolase [Candidatus Falkowbacteria bacterium CG10_big_fil_rev_8_21_14_0_10_39_11]